MANYFNIDLTSRLDQDDIASAQVIDFVVSDKYTDKAGRVVSMPVSGMDATTCNALKKVIDYATYNFEADALVLKIDYEAGVFDFSRSYLRDKISTVNATALPDGARITVRFEFAGFAVNPVEEAVFVVGSGFNADAVAVLLDAGIDIKPVEGWRGFGFTNTRECIVSFCRPADVVQQYIVLNAHQGEIIPPYTL